MFGQCGIIDVSVIEQHTVALGPHEAQMVADHITQLKAEGVEIFLISHDIQKVMNLCDRASVMKNSKLVGPVGVDDVTDDDLLCIIILRKQLGRVDA